MRNLIAVEQIEWMHSSNRHLEIFDFIKIEDEREFSLRLQLVRLLSTKQLSRANYEFKVEELKGRCQQLESRLKEKNVDISDLPPVVVPVLAPPPPPPAPPPPPPGPPGIIPPPPPPGSGVCV